MGERERGGEREKKKLGRAYIYKKLERMRNEN